MTSTAADGLLDPTVVDQLNSPDTRLLIDTIDSLRELQVGEIVNLPQIIVVGDQSCGKSSVLEAISRVRFPVKGDLCTRFATELILRRSPSCNVDVTIQFAGNETSSDSADAREPFCRSGFNRDFLPDVIDEAKERMGISDGSTVDFSKDILRVEISGPDVYPLTLVDLPGFFHTGTADQSQEGARVVNELAASYMKQKNSIILAVVSANNQLANQIVLQKAAAHDPKKERTLGVITKPDLLRPGSANEQKFLQLAKGLESAHKLRLGWHVLRNRAEEDEDTDPDERDADEERFFRTGSWNSISSWNRGIGSLRKKLSKVLLDHIQRSLPGLIQDIESNLQSRTAELGRLGKERTSPEDIRSYLLDIADDFQRLARDAVDGRYSDPFFGDLYQSSRKLRAKVRNFNRAFDATLEAKGARHDIQLEEFTDGDDESDSTEASNSPYLRQFLELYDFPSPEPITEAQLNSSLERMASENQGKEFPGLPNHDVVMQLFRMQSEPWKAIAERHLSLVSDMSKSFVEDLFSHLVGGDVQTNYSILHFCVDKFFEDRQKALAEKLQELLHPYLAGFSLPLDKEFCSRSSRRAINRLADQLADMMLGEKPNLFAEPTKTLTRQAIHQAVRGKDQGIGTEFGTEKVIDMMMDYYDMCLRTFTENIVNLAVESCLVSKIPEILTPRKVDRMSEDELRELGSESEEVQAERKLLKHQVDILRKGLEKCQRYRPREATEAQPVSMSTPSAAFGSRVPPVRKIESLSPTPVRTPAMSNVSTLSSASRNPSTPVLATNDEGRRSSFCAPAFGGPLLDSSSSFQDSATKADYHGALFSGSPSPWRGKKSRTDAAEIVLAEA